MGSTTVRISEETHETLRRLAMHSGRSMQALLGDAVEVLRRRMILDEANAGYAAMRSDPVEWAKVVEEREAWESTIADGLEDQ